MREFQVGDKVYISKSSEYYPYQGCRNGERLVGEVKDYDGKKWYRVIWDGNPSNYNSYKIHDLELIESNPKQKFKKGDWVRCVSDRDGGSTDAGNGWKKDFQFTITSVTFSSCYDDDIICWGGIDGNGVYGKFLELIDQPSLTSDTIKPQQKSTTSTQQWVDEHDDRPVTIKSSKKIKTFLVLDL